MKKKKVRYDNKSIARIIRERNFHQIREWLFKVVNIDVFMELIPDLERNIVKEYELQLSDNPPTTPSKEFLDSTSFVKLCSTLEIVDTRQVIDRIKKEKVDAYNILPYIIYGEDEWNYAIKKLINNRVHQMSLSDGVLFVCKLREAYFIASRSVPQPLTDLILKLQSEYIEKHDGVDMTVIESINTTINNKDVARLMGICCDYDDCMKFYDDCISSGARSANLNYPLLRPKYMLGNIWMTQSQYFPANIKDHMMITAYLHMVTQSKTPVEISQNVYGALERIVFEYGASHDIEIIEPIVDMIVDATEKDINNVRFLVPFKDIRDDDVQANIGNALKDVMRKLSNIESKYILRDFKYLYDNYGSPVLLSNMVLQRAFLYHGGNPRTLMKGHLGTSVNSYIYTVDGLSTALSVADVKAVTIMLQDKELLDIVTNDIIGKVYYYNAVDNVVKAIVAGKFTLDDDIKQLIGKINLVYPISEKESNSARLRISSLKNADLKNLFYDDVISNIPVANQSYNKIIQYVKVRKKYVPLYYGIDSGSIGIDKYFTVNLIEQMVSTSMGYIGDIESVAISSYLLERYCGK